jgi:hypothetical protein
MGTRLGLSAVAGVVALAVALPGAALAGTHSNNSPISTNEFNPTASSPYPSQISVADESGLVSKIKVTLSGVEGNSPDGLYALVVGPTGQTVVVMRNACGITDIAAETFTFDDAAPGFLPSNCLGQSGTYKPTDNDVNDLSFPAPAPAKPYGPTLSGFYGTQVNGTWKLFARDRLIGGDSPGIQAGWTLDFTTFTPPPCAGRTVTLAGTAGADALVGTAGSDVISGLGGDDTITGLGGKDFLCGGDGNDKVDGGGAKDLLFGNGGNDKLLGKGGKDKLNGGNGKDTCTGGGAKDKFSTCEKAKG